MQMGQNALIVVVTVVTPQQLNLQLYSVEGYIENVELHISRGGVLDYHVYGEPIGKDS